jgi:hypothetical protein
MVNEGLNCALDTKRRPAASKLLTGFDAPSCTYVYLDNELLNR